MTEIIIEASNGGIEATTLELVLELMVPICVVDQ